MTDAFAPAHITGFFSVRPDPDPLKAGSVGCGLCLEKGVTATIVRERGECIVRFNGRPVSFSTVTWVAERLLGSEPDLSIDLTCEIPLGFGFGISGAAALSTAFAIQATCHLGMERTELAGVAHAAEVVNRTGMGDVAGQCAGGLAMRTVPGAPGIGTVETIPTGPLDISWVCLGEIATSSVLEDVSMMKTINAAGERALKVLARDPGIDTFMSLSKEFAIETGLISSRALDAVEAVEALGGKASMAMLGETVFTVGGKRALEAFGQVGSSRIGIIGASAID